MKVCVFPVAERGFGAKPLALQAAATQARHLRGGPGLVEKDQPVRFKPHSWLPRGRPLLACLPDVGPILFAGQQRFFEAVAVANEPTRDRGGIGPCARGGHQFGRQLRHSDIVLLGDAGQQKRSMRIELSVLMAGWLAKSRTAPRTRSFRRNNALGLRSKAAEGQDRM